MSDPPLGELGQGPAIDDVSINGHKYVMGHFEFRNFVVTGDSRVMDHGPDADDFAGPTYIFSGHFHKRQANKNIIYIGNTFPTNFGDAGDPERGCAVFDVENEDVWFHNWEQAPLFFKTRLSRVLDGECSFPPRSRVRCTLDVPSQTTEFNYNVYANGYFAGGAKAEGAGFIDE